MKNKKLFAILTLVCFMFTLMPVAAFAAVDEQASYVYTAEKNVTVEPDEKVELTFDLDGEVEDETVYVWFEESGYADVAVKAVEAVSGVDAAGDGFFVVKDFNKAEVKFGRTGTFVLHAAVAEEADLAALEDLKTELRTEADYKTVVVEPAESESDKYKLEFEEGALYEEKGKVANAIEDNETVVLGGVKGDGAAVYAVSLKLVDKDGEAVYAPSLEVETTSGVSVTDLEIKRSGLVTFDVTASKAGTHKIYLTVADYKGTIKVDATDNEADSIVVETAPKTPINLDNVKYASVVNQKNAGDLSNYVTFKIYDAAGNEVNSESNAGVAPAVQSADVENYRNYVALTEKPAKSDLKSTDMFLLMGKDGWTIGSKKGFDKEGTYSFKVVLKNGEFTTVSFVVSEANDPVALSITYNTDSVQLGGTITPKSVGWLDANYVFTSASEDDVKFVVTGAAVKSVEGRTITVKTDEKYAGSEITVSVIDEENNLVATKTLTVAAEAKELGFSMNAVPVDATRIIKVSLVDENGRTVGLNATSASAYAVVLDKPAGSDVTVDTGDVNNAKGTFNMSFSADTVGTVKVQAVLKATVDNVVRYYTGIVDIKVGATGIEDTVVMSIGSNEVIVNEKVITIDCAPIVENSRTFVPFRALAEAFGAVVNYDEATQAVTAELDGTTVVMTIGSATYTVNGVEKTADVAPFIKDGRTMVPVRFAAQAFGITVTPTYDDNGATADVLFAK